MRGGPRCVAAGAGARVGRRSWPAAHVLVRRWCTGVAWAHEGGRAPPGPVFSTRGPGCKSRFGGGRGHCTAVMPLGGGTHVRTYVELYVNPHAPCGPQPCSRGEAVPRASMGVSVPWARVRESTTCRPLVLAGANQAASALLRGGCVPVPCAGAWPVRVVCWASCCRRVCIGLGPRRVCVAVEPSIDAGRARA